MLFRSLRYDELYRAHAISGASAMLALYQMTTHLEFGVMDLQPGTQCIQGFREKPSIQHPISMGVHMMNRRILEQIPDGQLYGLDHLMADLLTAQHEESPATQVLSYPFQGYWLDIGRHRDYESALEEFEMMKHRLLPDAMEAGTRVLPLSGDLKPMTLQPPAKKAGPSANETYT